MDEKLQICCKENRCFVQGLLSVLLFCILLPVLDLVPHQGAGEEEVGAGGAKEGALIIL